LKARPKTSSARCHKLQQGMRRDLSGLRGTQHRPAQPRSLAACLAHTTKQSSRSRNDSHTKHKRDTLSPSRLLLVGSHNGEPWPDLPISQLLACLLACLPACLPAHRAPGAESVTAAHSTGVHGTPPRLGAWMCMHARAFACACVRGPHHNHRYARSTGAQESSTACLPACARSSSRGACVLLRRAPWLPGGLGTTYGQQQQQQTQHGHPPAACAHTCAQRTAADAAAGR